MAHRRWLLVAALLLACGGCRSGKPMRELVPHEFAQEVVQSDSVQSDAEYQTASGLTPASVALLPLALDEHHFGLDSLRPGFDVLPGEDAIEVRGEVIATPKDATEQRGAEAREPAPVAVDEVHMAVFLASPPTPEGELDYRVLLEEPVAKKQVPAEGEQGLVYEGIFRIPLDRVPFEEGSKRPPVALVSVFVIYENGIALREVLQVPIDRAPPEGSGPAPRPGDEAPADDGSGEAPSEPGAEEGSGDDTSEGAK